MEEEINKEIISDIKIAPKKESGWQSFWELIRFAIIAIVIVIPIRVYIAQPFVVSGSSMFPTFNNADYLIIDEISYRLNNPKRYDVAVFRYPKDTTKFFIKRVIGLPGETVDITGNEVKITNKEYPEGFMIDQPFVKNPANNNTHFELKENEYFMMGDNRNASSDSRYWGAVSKDLIVGRAFLRLLPINNINLMPGHYTQTQ